MHRTWDEWELIAIRYLQKNHFTIRDTNFRFGRFGEIDIIAEKSGRVSFFEVKYRSHLGYGSPEEAIIPRKLQKCLKTMQFYCKKNGIALTDIQFDVLAILKKSQSHQVTHYRNIAF